MQLQYVYINVSCNVSYIPQYNSTILTATGHNFGIITKNYRIDFLFVIFILKLINTK